MEPERLTTLFDSTFDAIKQGYVEFAPQLIPSETGTVTRVANGIAKVSGLPNVGYDELVRFSDGTLGIAFNVDAEEIGVVLLGEYRALHVGGRSPSHGPCHGRRRGRRPAGARRQSARPAAG